MKKGFRKFVAVMLALVLICGAFADYYVSAQADGPAGGSGQHQTESQAISITINGVDIKDVQTIKDGDALAITVDWYLDDSAGADGQPITKQIDLKDLKNVNIPDIENRVLNDVNGRPIGHISVKDNVVTVVIDDQNFLVNEKGRRARGLVEGTIQVDAGEYKSGDKVPVEIQSQEYEFIYDDGTAKSYLWTDKQAGELTYQNGKWVQSYTVTVKSENGESTLSEVTDTAGDALKNRSSIQMQSNLAGSANNGTLSSFSELNGRTLKAGEQLTLTYTMEVEPPAGTDLSAVLSGQNDSGKNTVSVKYKNNKQEENETGDEVKINFTAPSIKKTLNAAQSSDDKQVWEIEIDLHDAYAKAGQTLQDVIQGITDWITDTCGAGLQALSQPLTASDFTDQGNGKYTATFETTLTNEYKNAESSNVSNKVTLKTIYGTTEGSDTYKTKGVVGASVEKTAGEYDPATGTISWTVVLKGVPSTATGVSVYDDTSNHWSWPGNSNGKTWGNHSLENTLKVNGEVVIENGKVVREDIISPNYSWGAAIDYSNIQNVYFADSFIQSNNGKDIVLTYETKVQNPNAMKDVLYYNSAELTYTPQKGDRQTRKDDDVYENLSTQNDALSKTGESDNTASAIDYTLTVDMDEVTFDYQGNLVITDILPEGLVYVDGSAGIEERFITTWGSWTLGKDKSNVYYCPSEGKVYREWEIYGKTVKPISSYSAALQTAYDENTRQLTFTVANQDDAFNVMKKYGELDNCAYKLVVTYRAEVADKKQFTLDNKTRTYTNTASGTYDDTSLGSEVQCTNQLTPKDVVTKTGAFVGEDSTRSEVNLVNFTLDINPDALDLSTGKLEAVDALSKDMTYDLDTIKVCRIADDGTESVLEEGLADDRYSYVYSPFENKITFILPDETHLKITYTTKAKVYVGADGSQSVEVGTDSNGNFTFENSLTLSGYQGSNMMGSFRGSAHAVRDRWIGVSNNASISLRKYWNNGTGMQPVEGSEFVLYQATKKQDANGNYYLEVDETGRSATSAGKTFTATSSGGKDYSDLLVTPLDYNQYYALVEVKGGTSVDRTVQMAVNPDPYFFVVENSDEAAVDPNLPSNCNRFAMGGYDYYPNEALTESGVIKIAKIWSEKDTRKLTWDDIKDSLTFTISGAGQTITCSGKDLKEVTGPGSTRYESAEFQVPVGQYTVTETCALDDYTITTTYTVTVTPAGSTAQTTVTDQNTVTKRFEIESGDSATVAFENVYDYTGNFSVAVKKIDNTGKELFGASFKITQNPSNNEFYKNIGPTVAGNTYTVDLAPGNYILEETQAPKGYAVADPVEFTVNEDGTVTVNGTVQSEAAVTMQDEPLDISISKYAIGGSAEVAGAQIAVYKSSDVDKNGKPIQGRTPVVSWTSEAAAPKNIGEYLIVGEEYVLIETGAPAGYGYSENITFTVKRDGTAEIATPSGVEVIDGKRIVMRDKAIGAALLKVDENGDPLSGAVLAVYNASDLDKNGRPKTGAVAVVSNWTSQATAVTVGDKLKADGEYALVEITAPSDYELADSIYFNVSHDGSIEVLGDADSSFDAATGVTTIQMEDIKSDAEIAKLVLKKTVSGDLTMEELDGELTFTVESIDPGNSYRQEFTLNKMPFNKEGNEYVLRLNLKPGNYKVTEQISTAQIEGKNLTVTYELSTDPGIKTTANGEVTGVELTKGQTTTLAYKNDYQDQKGTITVAKTYNSSGNTLNWNEIKGSLKFHIYDEEENEIVGSPISGSSLTLNTKTGAYESKALEVKVGKYTVKEEITPQDNLTVTTAWQVTVRSAAGSASTSRGTNETAEVTLNDKDNATAAFTNTYVRAYPVKISKLEIAGSKELPGARLQVFAGNNLKADPKKEWTSGEQPEELYLEPGDYTLVEETAPKGYAKAESIKFTVTQTGEITVGGQPQTGKTVVMKDAPLDIQISKYEIGGSEEVPGAEITVYLVKADGTRGAQVDKWISSPDGPHDIGSKLTVGQTYELVETGAPKGYGYTETVRFKVTEGGKVQLVQSGTELGSTQHSNGTATERNRIIMRDRAIHVVLNKVALSGGEEIDGAYISVYPTDADGNITGAALDTWVSRPGETHDFGGSLTADQDQKKDRYYVFVETHAPDGYAQAENIRFRVQKDGQVEVITAGVTNGGGIILMRDDIATGPVMYLMKHFAGITVTDELLRELDVTFRVESVGVENPIVREYHVGEAAFEWNDDANAYVRQITDLEAGTYKVTEICKDSVSGLVCTAQSYVLNLTRASNGANLSQEVAADRTGELALAAGDVVRIDFTNTYTQSTLVITKTIQGDVTKEEAEGALTFTVTDKATGTSNTYTLKDDFTYDAATGQWSKVLLLAAGGYTVKENVTTIAGKTYTVTYTVNGAESQSGDTAEVDVAAGGTTTVAYTNNYSNDESDDDDDDDDDDTPVLLSLVQGVTTSLTQTGDGAPLGIWLLLLICGGAGVAAGGIALKRRKKNN